MTTNLPLTDELYDHDGVLCPAELVEHATAESASATADLLVELLGDESTPEDVRRDVSARLTTLYHRFADVFDSEAAAAAPPQE